MLVLTLEVIVASVQTERGGRRRGGLSVQNANESQSNVREQMQEGPLLCLP